MKKKLSEIRKIIREELQKNLHKTLFEFVSNEMANGTSWKAGNKGWGAKNMNGVVNYYYGDDEGKNKTSASQFAKDSSRRPEDYKNASRK